ncbi:MAG TPA: DNA-directed RNA polymerase subunit delta [Bacilli bacterium]|mgnify:FL=1|nr:DNA-directed RNA polymerase subunit delta [Bacilli bacterium]
MTKRTNIEIAYTLLKEHGESLSFYDLWQGVVNEHEYSEAEGHDLISRFYTALTMDGRFVNLGDNMWALRENVLFDDIALPLNEVYTEVDEAGDEEEEDEGPEILYFDDETGQADEAKVRSTLDEEDEE